jgi:hypothetical protein
MFTFMNFVTRVADPANLCLLAKDSEILNDFCDGARYHRIQQALPEGNCALTSVLFFDKIQRDAKGLLFLPYL